MPEIRSKKELVEENKVSVATLWCFPFQTYATLSFFIACIMSGGGLGLDDAKNITICGLPTEFDGKRLFKDFQDLVISATLTILFTRQGDNVEKW